MNLSLLNYLKCVDCESESFEAHAMESASPHQITTGYIQCKHCDSVFPIIEKVLIIFQKNVLVAYLLPREIEVIEKYHIPINISRKDQLGLFAKGQVKTSKNWSFQWVEMAVDNYLKNWSDAIGDPEKDLYYDIPIKPGDYNGKTICEAGCGPGRAIRVLHEKPARYIAFDLSGSVYKAVKFFPNSEKLDILRTNMHTPPFQKEIFDVLFSPRAIHHTGNMCLALEKLNPLVKKDGILAFSVYSRENNFLMWGIIEPMKRVLNKFIPRSGLLALSSVATVMVMTLIHLVYVPFDKLGLKFLPLHNFFMLWSKFDFTTNKINVFDLLHAPYAEYISEEQINTWEKDFGWTPIQRELLHDTIWACSVKTCGPVKRKANVKAACP